MPKPPNKRAQRKRKRLFSQGPKDRIATAYTYPGEPLPAMTEEETRLDLAFDRERGDISRLWDRIDLLRRILVERRAALNDTSTYRAALDLLGTKALTDARGAYVLIRRGYVLASLGPLRAAWEAADLMHYFRLNPSEVEAWRAEDDRFATLGWVRKHLPEDPTPIYDFLAYGMHANWRFIPQLTAEFDASRRVYTLIPGPSRYSRYASMFALIAARQALCALRELHEHRQDVVNQPWRDEYKKCVKLVDNLGKAVSVTAKNDLELTRLLVEYEHQATQS